MPGGGFLATHRDERKGARKAAGRGGDQRSISTSRTEKRRIVEKGGGKGTRIIRQRPTERASVAWERVGRSKYVTEEEARVTMGGIYGARGRECQKETPLRQKKKYRVNIKGVQGNPQSVLEKTGKVKKGKSNLGGAKRKER